MMNHNAWNTQTKKFLMFYLTTLSIGKIM